MVLAGDIGIGRGKLVVNSRDYWLSQLSRFSDQAIAYPLIFRAESRIHLLCACGSVLTPTFKKLKQLRTDRYYCQSCRSTLAWKEHNESYRQTMDSSEYRETMSKAVNKPESLAKISKKAKEIWEDPIWRANQETIHQSTEYRSKLSTICKELHWSPEQRAKFERAINSESAKLKLSDSSKRKWLNEAYRAHISRIVSKRNKQIWNNPETREKLIVALNERQTCSSLQIQLYSMLDDLNVHYFREYPDRSPDPECLIGPWSFDCVVPRANQTTLLIECQGNYTHSLPKRERNDRAKATYIQSHLSNKYELKALWEHEFKNYNKIFQTLKYWLGLTSLEIVDFQFKDIILKDCPASDYRPLLGKYHYLPNAGRGGKAIGAYLESELIAVCVFSPPIRQNIDLKNYKTEQVRELSRLCIHPKYQKPNLATWFISRAIKSLPNSIKLIISYCDTTFNHSGAVYKAANFVLDRISPADYWYTDDRGWVMHKKTLYNQAVNLCLKESEFATKFGYHKVYGKEKFRFVLER